MHINDDHLYHGSALCQIAEHQSFTAINAYKTTSGVSRSAFRVNTDIGVYLKYATEPKGPYSEYDFTFQEANLHEIEQISEVSSCCFIALICVAERQICCLTKKDLFSLVNLRINACGGDPEDQFKILVTLPKGKSFRVYINSPGKKGKHLGRSITIARNSFPSQLFK